MNTETGITLALAFKIAAMGLAGATISLAFLDAGDETTYAAILAIGLFSLAVGSVMHQQQLRRGR